MCTKLAEIVIALNYRTRDASGTFRGGAMYTLRDGLGLPWLGGLFALLTSVAAFGIGNMVQANSVADSLSSSFGVAPTVTGLVLVALTAIVIVGGIRRIGEVAQVLVPLMSVVYLAGGLVVLAVHLTAVPAALALVFQGAFTGTAATGGFAGSTVALALRHGVARGLFSNEAGLGSAPMVHAAATTDHPMRQGLYGVFEVFVDTLLVCTITGLAIIATGVWDSGSTGAALSGEAFRQGLPGSWGTLIVTISVVLFAFSTVIGWSYYGETAIVYLVGTRAAVPYRLIWLVFLYLGATGSLQLIWSVADTLNGLMAIPNLISVIASIPLLLRCNGSSLPGQDSAREYEQDRQPNRQSISHCRRSNDWMISEFSQAGVAPASDPIELSRSDTTARRRDPVVGARAAGEGSGARRRSPHRSDDAG